MSFEITPKKQEAHFEKAGQKETPTRFDYYKLMTGLIGRAEELMSQKKDLAGEKIVKLLVEDPRNEAKLTPEQVEIVEKMVQRYEDAKNDVLSYTYALADKFGIKKLPKNPLEILEKNYDAKSQFLLDIGFKSPVDVTKFKINANHPTAIGIECVDINDYAVVSGLSVAESASSSGYFSYKDFSAKVASKSDKMRRKKLNQNIYFLNTISLATMPKKKQQTINHEIQHHLFRRYFDISKIAQLRHELEEIAWQVWASPSSRALEYLKGKGFSPKIKEETKEIGEEHPIKSAEEYESKLEKYKEERGSLSDRQYDLAKKEMEIPVAEHLEECGRDELAAYLKEGFFRYGKKFLFGKEDCAFVENPPDAAMKALRFQFDKLKQELWRLEAGNVDPKSLYKIFEIAPNFNAIARELSKINVNISENGLRKLLKDESGPELLRWLKFYVKEQRGFNIKSLASEIGKWVDSGLNKILEKPVGKLGKSDLDAANEYLFRIDVLVDAPNLKELKDKCDGIAALCLESIYFRAKGMDPVTATVIKEAEYNPHTGKRIETIDERIVFAEDVEAELRPFWKKFTSLISKMANYDKEKAGFFCEELYDLKDGHQLTLREKVTVAEKELEDLRKVEAELSKLSDTIYRIDRGQSLLKFLESAGADEWKKKSIRERYEDVKRVFEELNK